RSGRSHGLAQRVHHASRYQQLISSDNPGASFYTPRDWSASPGQRQLGLTPTGVGGESRASGQVAEGNAALAQIVGRHFKGDFITGQNADMVPAHLAARIGYYGMSVIQHDAKTRVGQDFGN